MNNTQPPISDSIAIASIGPNFADMLEFDLVLACQRREPGSFEQLLTRNERSITNILFRLAPEFTDTSDILQEASIRIWRSIHSLRDPRMFRAWLKRIVTNLYYDRLRKYPRDFWIVSLDDTSYYPEDNIRATTRSIRDAAPQPEERALGRELSDVLRLAVSAIPSQFREAMLLRDEQGMSYEEIAILTHASLGTVKSRISRARLKVQKQIAPYLEETALAS